MYQFVKRFIDILASSLGLLVLSPLLIPVCIILKCTGEHDIFYGQDRIGYKNKHFKILKFATMLRNSPNMAGGLHTTHGDPRVLPFGRFLRKTKINELPQIINVLKGDMSLVGPRPLVDKTFAPYSDEVKATIYNVKPGITGIGSIVFRDEEAILTKCKPRQRMIDLPSVSVIVPCYRVAEWLPGFTACLARQTYRGAWEAILVEDGDGCCAVVVESASVRVIRQPHGGVSAARNRGLEAATGDVILFADPDDAVAPDWIDVMVKAVEGVDLAWCGFRLNGQPQEPADVGAVYRDDAVRRRLWRAIFGYRLRDLWKMVLPGGLWTRCGREFASLGRLAVRRAALGVIRFDTRLRLFEDALYVAALARRATSLRIAREAGYDWRVRPGGSMTRELRGRMVENKFAARDARRALDPSMSHWRGTYLLSIGELLLKAKSPRLAWRYACFENV